MTIRNFRGDGSRAFPCSGEPERSRGFSRVRGRTPSSSRFPTRRGIAWAWSSTPARWRRCRAASSVATSTSILTPSSARPPTERRMTVVTARTTPAEQTLADRLLAAVPLLSIFLWLAIVYVIQAWAHKTPWLFGDELELTQLSRAIADTGHAARRGEPYSFTTLWTYVLAPAWLIDNLHAAYATVKYLTVIVMTATVFPAYGIARIFVGRRPALFLILRALLTPSRWWIGGAVATSLIAPLVRGELGMLPAIFLLAAIFLLWRSEYASQWRRSWTGWDWLGFVTLVVGAVVIVSAVVGHRSLEWNYATRLYKGRMLDLGLDAAGALTIGLGVLPVVAGLSVLWRAPGEPVSYALRVFRSVLLAAIISFGLYTAVKSTYVSISFGTYTYERNLIYLAPLLFTGPALWLERRRLHPI